VDMRSINKCNNLILVLSALVKLRLLAVYFDGYISVACLVDIAAVSYVTYMFSATKRVARI
jgi:hypothetical protein